MPRYKTPETQGEPLDDILDDLPALKRALGGSRRHIYVPDSLWRSARMLALADDITVSQLYRQVMRDYIAKARADGKLPK